MNKFLEKRSVGLAVLKTAASTFLVGSMAFGISGAWARDADNERDVNGRDENAFCSQTALALLKACRNEVEDDFFVAKAKCINVSDQGKREQCLVEAKAARKESKQLCREQRDGRLDACQSLGEDRYDPDFDPALFGDPRNPTNPNPYFPLGIGNQWEYRGGAETNTVRVLNQTKLIAGVTCIVVRDKVFKDGDLVENTDDWYAPAQDGNVWYCGEEVKDFESFEGDDPRRPELVKIDGSFKAGRDGDKPGIIFQASCPRPTHSAATPNSTSSFPGHSRSAFAPPAIAW
jgi:hypothetical protein